MKRRRRCQEWSGFAVDIQCARLARHDGSHGASPSSDYGRHWAWSDADLDAITVLPGTVWFHETPAPGPRSRAFRVCEWVARALTGAGFWYLSGPLCAAVYFGLATLLSVRRPHFVDVGRFTAGVFLVSRRNFPPIFAFGFTRYGPQADALRSGLQIVFGPVSLMVCALLPRNEWADFQSRNAERAAKRKAAE
ncbi:hypothetical protein OG345_42200 (plasmid) [Streptomyces sp. NBC_01220]|uniref:hypothetical protein n=1 Tax=Streptomyces sp. NBC_01220 TaxID=2903781 RepID=UPI00352DBF2E|nr:hypothetical protein OG345_42200 [Streptomyces sp. NBC_01220]